MIGDPIGEPLEQLLDRLRGPGSRSVFELVERSQLHRPIMIDTDEAMTAVRPYAWLLDRVGDDGIKLTGAGRFPPAVVTEAMAILEDRVDWIGKANARSTPCRCSSCGRQLAAAGWSASTRGYSS